MINVKNAQFFGILDFASLHIKDDESCFGKNRFSIFKPIAAKKLWRPERVPSVIRILAYIGDIKTNRIVKNEQNIEVKKIIYYNLN